MSVGQILAEKYRLVEQLSRGGMGSVWRAEHIELGTPAAVKLIDPVLAETEDALLRFRREAQSAASLRSSNIVQIFDYGVAQGIPYIAMELLRGQSLARRLANAGTLSAVETAIILSQVAKAVAWAHSMGVVHRDLKPDNVFLAEDAGETVVKLLDFGIAKTFDLSLVAAPTTMTGAMMGTPFYMSPEQAGGKKTVDYRSDIWSFAVIAFECLTGKRPFYSDTLGGLVLAICSEPLPKPSSIAVVPPGFDEWFARAAHRNLELRYTSIREAAKELRRICAMGLDDEALGPLSASGVHSGPDILPGSCLTTSTVPIPDLSIAMSTMGGASVTRRPTAAVRFRTGIVVMALLVLFGAAISAGVRRRPSEVVPVPSLLPVSTQAKQSEQSDLSVQAYPVDSPPPVDSAANAREAGNHSALTKNGAGSRGRAKSSSPSDKLPQISAGLGLLPAQGHAQPSAAPVPVSKPSGPDLDKVVGF